MKFVAPIVVVLASAAGLARAITTLCIDTTVDVSAAATNFNITANSPFNASGTFSIEFKYCTRLDITPSTLLILTHGITYNSYYWDSGFQPAKYSFVQYAMLQGYATLNVVRLGYGNSARPDPDNIVQYPLGAAIVAQVITLARNGQIPNVPQASIKKYVFVGHSAGSAIGNAILTNAPALVDGAVLTGFSHAFLMSFDELVALYDPQPAAVNVPARFASLPQGYITTGDFSHRLNAFYGPTGTFDPAVAQYDENHKDTSTVGENATFNITLGVPAAFSGPVFIVNGANDILFCSSVGCPNLETEGQNFPSSSSFSFAVIANTGHSLNFQLSAQQTFSTIVSWLRSHGF